MAQMGPTIIYVVVLIAIFYFLLIRPQKKQEKQMKAMINALKKGDVIVTIGGFQAKIISVKGDALKVQIGDNKAKLEKWAVKSVLKVSDEDPEEAEELEENTEE
jgi:preprotein translocase subunit YajC